MRIADITIGERHRKDLGDIDALARSIADVGLLHPVVVTPDGLLIAGQRRLEACKRLGWSDVPATVARNLTEAIMLMKAERDENTCREALKPTEAFATGKDLEELEKPAAEARMMAGIPSSKLDEGMKGRTDETVAAAIGMKRQTYRKVKKVMEAAIAQPGLLADVVKKMDETGNISAALKEVEKRKHEQEAKARLTDLPPMPERFWLYHGDFRNICAAMGDGSINVILTDPPYEKDSLSLYDDLGRVAGFLLGDGGSLFVMSGQSYLPEVIASLSKHLTYHWTLAYLTPGGQAVQLWQRNVNTFWKPVLWFVKGTYTGPWIGDVAKSNVNANEKDSHRWQQSESGMMDLVARCSQIGDLILDPFCGSGTTGVAALAMGRRFTGVDIDAAALETARVRLAEATCEQL